MSAQNSLKKPKFTKSVRGYTVQEVDSYIEYVNERYSAVCRESAELKRKLTRFKLGLDRPDGQATPTNTDISYEELIKQIENLRRELSAECERHAEHLKRLSRDFENDTVNNICNKNNAEAEAENLKTDAGPSQTDPSDSENTASEAEIAEVTQPEKAAVSDKPSAEDNSEEGKGKSPAQLAEEIDFYSDSVHADGESFDPMAFAADAAAKYARPSFTSLMKDDSEK